MKFKFEQQKEEKQRSEQIEYNDICRHLFGTIIGDKETIKKSIPYQEELARRNAQKEEQNSDKRQPGYEYQH